MLTAEQFQGIDALRLDAADAAAQLDHDHVAALRLWQSVVQDSFHRSIEQFQANVSRTSRGNALCQLLAELTADYVEWMQWALGDIPIFAIAIEANPELVSQRIGPCALVYFAGRVLDDFLDRHHLYRGRRVTLLGSLAQRRGTGAESEALTVLLALLLTLEGLEQLPRGADDVMRQVITSLRRLVTGILMDCSEPQHWSEEFYEHLIELKNVDYWRILYDALDPKRSSKLYQLLCGYYALAQKLNDLEDAARDESQGRPNIVSVFRSQADSGRSLARVLPSVAASVTADLLQLYGEARQLSELEKLAALKLLGHSRSEMEKLGVFGPEQPEHLAVGVHRGGLAWHATVDEFVQRYGIDAIETTSCPVCHLNASAAIFRKQGFQYNRCSGCTHIFVSPRLRDDIIQQMNQEQSGEAPDPFLESQSIYVDHICRLLSARSIGRRLLDIGHGRGHLMLAARAYGFQVHGIDSDENNCASLRPVFGDHVQQLRLPARRLPWGSFDHIVMSHVLEHLAEPAVSISAVAEALQPGAFLYVAVPDSEALQFRIFGRLWDAVHPILHPQFFNERSLRHLIEGCGLEFVARIPSPTLTGPGVERWMRMFRSLGGDESGELAILARRKGASELSPAP
ncbi:class I SAM-dependent methyltransferase [Occallatibacter riparius]|uniref:Class I SAM-dependent methyltransferase n=1 Tax=Occallatibacter riparius TaxID=1002689 RepID=A0A9J7BSG4_9BACT|nr:class I SAM-dependent methyltransferase [Occallatibacter riparius]UWZ85521.1 class I SAM-dependent methyltransferase [Occallatibacter riparius]